MSGTPQKNGEKVKFLFIYCDKVIERKGKPIYAIF